MRVRLGIIIALCIILLPKGVLGLENGSIALDTDGDGLTDQQEIVYHTDPQNPDTDGDGYSDGVEVKKGFSPLVSGDIRLDQSDIDKDGLTDAMEIKFKTDMTVADTDGDGFPDGAEIQNGYDPNDLTDQNKKLDRKIVIDLKRQRLQRVLGGVTIAEYTISSGKRATPTPKGTFAVRNKTPRAWSKQFGLYMPWWMAFTYQGHGMHELPEWPNGYKEGTNHLGTPVSHGCVRLGIGPAKELYDWAPVGTPVVVQ